MDKKYCLTASVLLIIPILTTSMEVEEDKEKKFEQREQQGIHHLIKQLQDPNELNTWLKAGEAKSLNKEFSAHMRDQLIHNIRPTLQYLQNKTLKPFKILAGHKKTVYSVAFSPDGTKLASGSSDNTIKLWDVKTGNEKGTLTGHGMKMRMDVLVGTVYSVEFSPDGKMLASGSEDGTAKLWDVETGKVINNLSWLEKKILQEKMIVERYKASHYSVAFSSDGKMLASGLADYTIKLWDVKTGNVINTLTGHTDRVTSVAFNPYGKMLASGSWDNSIKLWDVKTGTITRTLTGHKNTVDSVAFSPDGKMLASGSADSTIKLWDVKTGNKIHTLKCYTFMDWVTSVAFSPDGTILASAAKDTIKLWNVKTGKEIHTLIVYKDFVNSVAFSPDGIMLAAGTESGTIVLWRLVNLKDVEQLSTLELLLINLRPRFRLKRGLSALLQQELYKIYKKSSDLVKTLIPEPDKSLQQH